jgi:hypothetical protein
MNPPYGSELFSLALHSKGSVKFPRREYWEPRTATY